MISLYNLINHKQYYVALLEHDTLHLSFVSTCVLCLYLLKYQLSCKAIKTSGYISKGNVCVSYFVPILLFIIITSLLALMYLMHFMLCHMLSFANNGRDNKVNHNNDIILTPFSYTYIRFRSNHIPKGTE